MPRSRCSPARPKQAWWRRSTGSAAATSKGRGVPFSRAEAVRWLERAAERGYIEAQAGLAVLYVSGLGAVEAAAAEPTRGLFSVPTAGPPDLERAALWARRAAEGGSAEGQSILGFVLSAGTPNAEMLAESEAWFMKAAAAGNPQGALGYGLALLRRPGTPENLAEAARNFIIAADAQLPAGEYLLGVMLEKGAGVEADATAAATLFKRAAERGLRSAQARWGLSLQLGRGRSAQPGRGRVMAAPGGPAGRSGGGRAGRRHVCQGAATCRRTTPRPRPGSVVPPRPATNRPPARSP